MSPDSNHLNFTFCAGCSRILILHSMAVLCWLVAGGWRWWQVCCISAEDLPERGRRKQSPVSPLLPGDQAAEAGLQLGSVLSLSVFTAAAHCCVHYYSQPLRWSLLSPVHRAWPRTMMNPHWSLHCGRWSPLQLLQTSSVRTQLATSARWSRGPVTTAILFSNIDIDVHWYNKYGPN